MTNSHAHEPTRPPGPAHQPGPAQQPAPAHQADIAGVLRLDGAIAAPLEFDRAELARFPADAHVADVARLVPGRAGRAVTFAALLERAHPRPDAAFVDVASSDPDFAISVPLAELRGALIVYELDGAPLPAAKGGPLRLLVPGHADECVHVKQLARLSFGAARGRDTRPVDDAEHQKLHAKKKS